MYEMCIAADHLKSECDAFRVLFLGLLCVMT